MPLYISTALKLLTCILSVVEVPAQSQESHQYLNATSATTNHSKYLSEAGVKIHLFLHRPEYMLFGTSRGLWMDVWDESLGVLSINSTWVGPKFRSVLQIHAALTLSNCNSLYPVTPRTEQLNYTRLVLLRKVER